MKKIIYITSALLLILLGGLYFLNAGKNNSSQINYTEPETKFLNKVEIPAEAITVEIKENEFEPESLEIKKGETVTWLNSSGRYAWPASDPHPTHTNYSDTSPFFDPELPMKADEAWSFTFSKPGNWRYHDHLDSSKRGVIVVSE